MDVQTLRDFNQLTHLLRKNDRNYTRIINDEPEFEKKLGQITELTPHAVTKCALEIFFKNDKRDAKYWIIKPGYLGWEINTICAKMPDMKFIHVVRDGRAVLNSMLTTKRVYGPGYMAEDPLAQALKWRLWINLIDKFSEKYPEKICEVQFEALVKEPATELMKIRQFLGIDPHLQPAHSKFTNYKQKIPEIEKSLHQNIGKKPILKNIEKWKENCSEEFILLFEIIAGCQLRTKGYVPEYYQGNVLQLFSMPIITAAMKSLVQIGARRIKKIGNRS